MRHVARITSACLLCAVVGVLGGAGCPIFDALLNGGLVGFSNAGVRLRIENQSGLKASVLAVYHLGPEEVRRTDRLLPPEGGESTTEVIRTLTDDIMVVAKVANDAALPIGGFIQSGDMLIQAQYRFGLDFFGGETLVLVIPPPDATALLPPPIIDCNHNETPDDLDIQNGTSLDCNENVIPDECEIDMNNNSSFGGPFFCDPAVEDCAADCNENGVPDECDICQEQAELPAITIEGAGFPLPTQITLSPDNAVHEVNTRHSLTAMVMDLEGAPVAGVFVDFVILDGPNRSLTEPPGPIPAPDVTDASGKTTFGYVGAGGIGVDMIQASFLDRRLTRVYSNIVIKNWGERSCSLDCNANGIPDECESDSNDNGVIDDCEN